MIALAKYSFMTPISSSGGGFLRSVSLGALAQASPRLAGQEGHVQAWPDPGCTSLRGLRRHTAILGVQTGAHCPLCPQGGDKSATRGMPRPALAHPCILPAGIHPCGGKGRVAASAWGKEVLKGTPLPAVGLNSDSVTSVPSGFTALRLRFPSAMPSKGGARGAQAPG